MNQHGIHQETFTVRYHEADRRGILKLANWFDFLQESAANHADELGIGYHDLNAINRMWVLSRLRLALRRPVRLGETLRVDTWPSSIRRLFAHREFTVRTAEGETVATASSAWLLLSADKHRPVRPDTLAERLPAHPELPEFFQLAEKLQPEELPFQHEIPVRYSMEDVNGHLNNAEYAGLVQDLAVALGENAPDFREIEVHYLAAIQAPDRLRLFARRNGERFQAQGALADGEISFVASALF